MIGSESKKLQIIVAKTDAELIEELAKKEKRSISNWVAMLIDKELQKYRSQITKKKKNIK